jgi:hypothetical protein
MCLSVYPSRLREKRPGTLSDQTRDSLLGLVEEVGNGRTKKALAYHLPFEAQRNQAFFSVLLKGEARLREVRAAASSDFVSAPCI